jgi:hypothetical protein
LEEGAGIYPIAYRGYGSHESQRLPIVITAKNFLFFSPFPLACLDLLIFSSLPPPFPPALSLLQACGWLDSNQTPSESDKKIKRGEEGKIK